MTNNENRAMCAACGGRCCQSLPGAFLPEEVSLDALRYLLVHQLVSLTREFSYDMDTSEETAAWVVRPLQQNGAVRPYEQNPCEFLTEMGCMLDWEDRPYECRALVPGMPNCWGDVKGLVHAWAPYRAQMDQLVDELDLW